MMGRFDRFQVLCHCISIQFNSLEVFMLCDKERVLLILFFFFLFWGLVADKTLYMLSLCSTSEIHL